MKIVNVEFNTYRYWHNDNKNFLEDVAKVTALTDEGIKSKFVINAWKDPGEGKHHRTFEAFPTLASEAQVVELLIVGFEVTVTPGMDINPDPEVLFNPKVPEGPTDQHMNNRVEVHMPGQALAMYNDTLLMEDSCTDALQNELANGWRIIAVCPQPDQRRPDYVLGRYNPNVGIDTEAKRG
tara:strand:- start:38918 stop:39460 length:543 start_codon:yes stop_codon:yes gene_type:complete